MTRGSEQIVVHSVRTKIPLVLQVLAPAADLKALRIDAATVVAPMPNNVVLARCDPIQHTEDEAAGWQLPALAPDLHRACSIKSLKKISSADFLDLHG
ncbi:hypothetical protein [Ostreiculturibacter nitratireducens]|uniref:hypothetical protein n=1 Tax=Ostreiculturibacter nitratireducens TaxID=3075226 RepID=UPI0031B64198